MLDENFASPVQVIRSVFEETCGPGRPIPTDNDLPKSGDKRATVVNRMESFWIRILHAAFRACYNSQQDVVVLSKAKRDLEWHRNEFLHDVAVIERFKVESAHLKRPLPVARRILWQVESELSSSGREVAIDFSKLVAGSAENKLMIVRRPPEWQKNSQGRVLRFIQDMAAGFHGNLFLAFLPTYTAIHGQLGRFKAAHCRLPVDIFARNCSTGKMIRVEGLGHAPAGSS